jgi:hypothetical protein
MLMIYAQWKDTCDDIKKDEMFKNTVMAKEVAERMYRDMLKNTEFVIHRNPVTIVNETDIDWGNDKEVYL